ncbi:MAG TPA: HAMP domain-containing sensor histidine kinase [Polyangiaceae bacterium]|jgi:signal transduction histidine kinase|nr:HAMP domain-containing sensor histidine kinase [Polyangiaceae bacterium]
MKLLRKSLGWRLYAVGVVQVVLFVCAAWLIGYVGSRMAERTDPRAVATELKPLLGDRAALRAELDRILKRHGLLLSAYDEADHLVATNAEPALPPPHFGARALHGLRPGEQPLGPPPRDPRFHGGTGEPPFGPPPFGGPPGMLPLGPPPFGEHPHDGHDHGLGPPPDMYTKLEFPSGDGVLVARIPHPGPGPFEWVLALVSGLVVVGVGAYLTTRWITGPLGELSRAARSLGRGDLSARTNLSRSDELGEVGRVFDEMAARMSELLLAEKELLANLSHELRTPLARIRVALEIAAEGDAAAARASLGEIAHDLSELEALIDDVLATTRLAVESRQASPAGFALRREEIAPRTLCERAAERFRTQHPGRPLEVVIEGEPPPLLADPTLLRRVIDNLLENAHKYSKAAGEGIVLRARAAGDQVVFEVSDHGIGIPDEDLPRIFDPFFRSERSRSRGTGGVGLGLTLAKRIVEAHGGKIAVESAKTVGTTVRASVPSHA